MEDIQLTDAERADVKSRIAGLAEEVKKMDITELKALAQKAEVPLEKYPERRPPVAAGLKSIQAGRRSMTPWPTSHGWRMLIWRPPIPSVCRPARIRATRSYASIKTAR